MDTEKLYEALKGKIIRIFMKWMDGEDPYYVAVCVVIKGFGGAHNLQHRVRTKHADDGKRYRDDRRELDRSRK